MSMNIDEEEKDELITIIKKALELACIRLACYEGMESSSVNPEEWIKRAYLLKLTDFKLVIK